MTGASVSCAVETMKAEGIKEIEAQIYRFSRVERLLNQSESSIRL